MTKADAANGIELSRAYWEQVVAPIVLERWPSMPHAAARLGHGSDVLDLDDEMSRDHDWGLRLNLFVPPEMTTEVDAALAASLPDRFAERPTRFTMASDATVRHRVAVADVRRFTTSTLGVNAWRDLTVDEWLSVTGQGVLEVTAGAVFVDTNGELSGIRHRLRWYPDDVWRYVVAVDWARLEQELPFVGRTGGRGDDLGSRVLAARLAGIVMHLGFLLERRWPPYSKWIGTVFATLQPGEEVTPLLGRALAADDWREREAALVEGVRYLALRQRDVGLPDVGDPVGRFYDRPAYGIRPEVIEAVTASIVSARVRDRPYGMGSTEQRSHNVNVLLDAAGRAGVRSSAS
ncbi:MAG: DUF4037 domain-containing protein [Terracoccus sp.]